LREYLAKTGPWSLIVAEPLSRVGGPDAETDNAAATRLVQVFESIVKLTGATVLGAHHTNKPGRGGVAVTASSARGSSALIDGFRWAASLASRKAETLGEVVTLEVVKSNYSFKGDPLLLRRGDGGRIEPLNSAQLAQYEADASGATGRTERATRREEERDAQLAQREERQAEKKAQREREKAAEAETKRTTEENALRAILRGKPGIHTDELRGALSAALGGCTRDRMRDIIARLGSAVVAFTPDSGPANARAYRLAQG